MLGDIPTVRDTIREFQDQKYSGFIGFPTTTAKVAEVWCAVADALLQGVVPASSTIPAAQSAFKGVMGAISASVNGVVILQNAFQAYATALASGMAPAGFVGTPPPSPPMFTLTGMVTKSAEAEAANMAAVLFAWAKTGTATPLSGGSPITWT